MRDHLEIPNLVQELQILLAQLPAGRVTTPGALAETLGSTMAARWIGHFLLHHEHTAQCPCHRVVRAGGLLGPYIAGGERAKARRLIAEGVPVDRGTVDLDHYRCEKFVSDRPLERLKRLQETLAAKVSLRRPRRLPSQVTGVDVAYPSAEEGVAACATVEFPSGKLLWSITIRRRVTFPYVTSFLSFRELPILLDLLHEAVVAGHPPQLVLVDGSGVLHPRHAGIASHLGVVAGLSTIGVTKKLLCGQVDIADLEPGQSRPVVLEDQIRGAALRPTAGSRRPIFISAGHRTDLRTAEDVVRRLLLGRRLPEPLYWADRLTRKGTV